MKSSFFLFVLVLLFIPVAVVSAQETTSSIEFEILNYEVRSVSFTLIIPDPPDEKLYDRILNWSFGDGNVSLNDTSTTVFHSYASFGVYNVSVVLCYNTSLSTFCRDPAYLILKLCPLEPDVESPLRLNFFRAFLSVSLVVWSILVAFSAPDKRKGKVGILLGIMVILLSTFFFATDAWIWFLNQMG